jgi:predicted HD superfamily hydrolase involved in NAD metabolism
MREFRHTLDALSSDALHRPLVCESEISESESRSAVQPMVQPTSQLYDRTRVIEWLATNVPEKRLQHILRVEVMAIHLAKVHGLNGQQAAQAGLMHDLAKYFKPQRLLAMAEAEGLVIDPVDQINPHLLHAQVGAIVARDQFGVDDSEVLDAIRNHTLGNPEMSLLSCVVFLADSLEPGRGETAELQRLRHVAETNVHRAVWQTSDFTLKHLLDTSQMLHPRAVQTRNWALQVASQKVHKSL